MKAYSKNEKPFVYAVFSDKDEEKALEIIGKIYENDIAFWFAEQFSKKEFKRIEAAYSCILFISNNALLDEKVNKSIDYAEKYNKKILCIYLEPTVLTPGKELQLNALQSIDKSSFKDEEAFYEKLKSAEIFSDMKITPAQKRFAKRRALASALLPVAAAVVAFFAVVLPLTIIPMVQAANGSLSKVGFGNLSLSELAKIEELTVIGTQSYDQWYFAFYNTASKDEVYVNELNTTVPTGDISDISDLALLKNAKAITFEANRVSDISPLYQIKTLENLTLNCNPIKSIEGIEALQNLKSITMVCTEISDISPLFRIPSMKYISFENTYVGSIEGIENLKGLVGLRTGNSNITDLSPLNKIDFSYVDETEGFAFEAKESLIKDFSPIARIPKFSEIMVTGKRMDSILPYISDKQVRTVYIGGSDINTVEELSSVQGIEALYLPGSFSLTTIEGIEQHTGLIEVELINCPNINDFTPLLKLPNLRKLTITKDMEELALSQLQGLQIIYDIRD